MEYAQPPFTPSIPAALHHAVEIGADRPFVVTPERELTRAAAEAPSRRLDDSSHR